MYCWKPPSALKVFGKPSSPFFSVVYPVIVSNNQVIWVVRHAVGILQPDKPDFQFADTVITDIGEVPKATEEKEMEPETITVDKLLV